jgi:hypothetical protein
VKAGSKRSDIWEDLHWTFWFSTCGKDANVRECDTVGWLGKVLCHDDVTGSNRAEAREVPALDLFQLEVPKLCYPSNPEQEPSKVNIMDYAASLFSEPRMEEFYLHDEKSHKKDALT